MLNKILLFVISFLHLSTLCDARLLWRGELLCHLSKFREVRIVRGVPDLSHPPTNLGHIPGSWADIPESAEHSVMFEASQLGIP